MNDFDTLHDEKDCTPEIWSDGRYWYVKCHHTITRRGFGSEAGARRFIEVELHMPQPVFLMAYLGGE